MNAEEKLLDAGYEGITIDEISIVVNMDGNINGLIILVTSADGYGGDIQMAIGVDMACNIKGISFLSINETVGLGMEAQNEEFISQFYEKGVVEFAYSKTGAVETNEVDALSGATITTSAVVDGVNAALYTFLTIFYGGM